MKYLRVGLPFLIVLFCVFSAISAYGADNSMAMNGYWLAFCGWVAIAWDEYLTYKRNKRFEDATNPVA
jgi:hypothetical protein